MKGFVVENKHSPSECLALEFASASQKDEVRRLILNGKPFLEVVRTPAQSGVLLHREPSPAVDPTSLLYRSVVRLDDATRRVTNFDVRIPEGVEFPGSWISDYRRLLRSQPNFEGIKQNARRYVKEHPERRELLTAMFKQ
jgi:hypothetical protein